MGDTKNEMPLSVITLLLSLFSSSFGITKFFVKGPLPILPTDAPLAGALSGKFLILFLLNTMFVVRTFCIEASFFSSYRDRFQDYIDPLIPEEYRLILYLLPAILSFLINLIKITLSIKPKQFLFFSNHPQFLLCPMFCPLMFEINPDRIDESTPPVRVWKLGSVLNYLFMGCLPQVLLISLDYYRGVTAWSFTIVDSKGQIFRNRNQANNALLKYSYGNTIFSIATFLFYLFLIVIFFTWDKMFKSFGLCCSFCKATLDELTNMDDVENEEQVLEPTNQALISAGKTQDRKNIEV